jgi:hypothetical protein
VPIGRPGGGSCLRSPTRTRSGSQMSGGAHDSRREAHPIRRHEAVSPRALTSRVRCASQVDTGHHVTELRLVTFPTMFSCNKFTFAPSAKGVLLDLIFEIVLRFSLHRRGRTHRRMNASDQGSTRGCRTWADSTTPTDVVIAITPKAQSPPLRKTVKRWASCHRAPQCNKAFQPG